MGLIVYTFVYAAIRLSPADPVRSFLGPLATESAINDLRHEQGWDLPLFKGLLVSLKRSTNGDFGHSFYYNQPALDLVLNHAPVTYLRTFLSFLIGTLSGLLLGLLSGLFSWKKASSFFSLMYAVPSFCFIVLFLWISSSGLGLTPLSAPLHFEILAVLCGALYPAGAVANQMANRLDFHRRKTLYIDFLKMLHADSKQVAFIVWREGIFEAAAIALNSVPVIFTAISFAEIIFNLKGFGSMFIASALRNDLSIVITAALVLAATYLLIQKTGDYIGESMDIRLTPHE